MNLPESLPSSGTPDLAAQAAKSAVLRRAASLAGWAGRGKRILTAKGVLRKQDVPAAAAIIGVKAPQAVRSAADLPELHVAWCAAIGMGLLTVEGGKASGGPELKNWPPDDGTGLLEAWLKGFFAVSAGLGGDQDLGRGIVVLVLALLKVLQDEDAPAGRGLLREVLEEADEICDEHDLDVDVYGALSGLSSHGMPRIEGLMALLADFGMIAKARPTASKAPAVTPLGEWVASRLAQVCPVPLDAGLTAEELIEEAANFPADERETLADSWLDARDPADAVREILSAAEDMPSRLRVVALELAEMTGEDGWPAWREIAGDEARPHAARHARVFLFSVGQGPEPARADWQWVGTEAAAAALDEAGPDEALCCIWDTIDGDDDIAKRLAEVRASGHPEAEHVASSVEAFTASGAPLTIWQGVELKVALKYAKPPVWRSAQLPLTATLGDLHAAIQVLFGWDGDHLHVFHAVGVRYSDPFYELEGTEDEEDARLRDAFPPGGPKITYVYDFGTDWIHEITRQKVITLEPGQDYPVCVAFGGKSPVEYPSEDEPEEPEPFDQAAVNTALAGILRS
ncbi:MAG TPA: plasmid pRiA4b ORF-3 family protein [Streptosporangiaceae bacterium]